MHHVLRQPRVRAPVERSDLRRDRRDILQPETRRQSQDRIGRSAGPSRICSCRIVGARTSIVEGRFLQTLRLDLEEFRRNEERISSGKIAEQNSDSEMYRKCRFQIIWSFSF